MAYQAIGVAIIIAMMTSLIKSIDNKPTMLLTSAPNTFRIPISFVRNCAVYVANPSNPRQAIKMARQEKVVNNLLKIKSDLYCLLKSSSTKLYKNGLCGASLFHTFSTA